MRLTEEQVKIIKEGAGLCFGEKSRVYLFGSRTDDSKKGGDIDILIEADFTDGELFRRRLDLLVYLNKKLGERKIDIVTYNYNNFTGPMPLIIQEAFSNGIML